MKKIILATESTYKKQLFERLNLDFQCVAANTDESPAPEEPADHLARRLSRQKAERIFSTSGLNECWVIGADQSASWDGKLVSKPVTHEQAVADLKRYSGNQIDFYTAACVMSPDGRTYELSDKTSVYFRELTLEEIENYLRIDHPYDCAGAFKAESLGISLFTSIESRDPTALIGLPLLKLGNLLREQGFDCYKRD